MLRCQPVLCCPCELELFRYFTELKHFSVQNFELMLCPWKISCIRFATPAWLPLACLWQFYMSLPFSVFCKEFCLKAVFCRNCLLCSINTNTACVLAVKNLFCALSTALCSSWWLIECVCTSRRNTCGLDRQHNMDRHTTQHPIQKYELLGKREW